jgi:hypothetical protein
LPAPRAKKVNLLSALELVTEKPAQVKEAYPGDAGDT